jgi:hypothetical protein
MKLCRLPHIEILARQGKNHEERGQRALLGLSDARSDEKNFAKMYFVM